MSAFRAAWGVALDAAVKTLEAEALRRVDRSRWACKLSDPFIERLLKAHRPWLYTKHADTKPLA